MPRMLLPMSRSRQTFRRRHAWGADRKDEAWNGVYVMAPDGDNQHQGLTIQLAIALREAVKERTDAQVFPGVNVTDQTEKWTKNYRCPDVAVFLPNNPAEDRVTHWLGGPDLAVEVVSKGDRSRQKLDFNARVGVRELLLIDRDPWQLELFRLNEGRLVAVGRSVPLADSAPLVNKVLPVSFRLIPAETRPRIVVTQTADGRAWRI